MHYCLFAVEQKNPQGGLQLSRKSTDSQSLRLSSHVHERKKSGLFRPDFCVGGGY